MNPLFYRHMSNIEHPGNPYAEMTMIHDHHTQMAGRDAMRREWFHHLDWVNAPSHILGKPKGTSYYSSEQLEAGGMIGVYKFRYPWMAKVAKWLKFPDWTIFKVQNVPKSPEYYYSAEHRTIFRHCAFYYQ